MILVSRMYMFKKSLIVNENIKLPFNFFPINLYWQIVVSQACIKKIGYYYFCALRKLTFYKGYKKQILEMLMIWGFIFINKVNIYMARKKYYINWLWNMGLHTYILQEKNINFSKNRI